MADDMTALVPVEGGSRQQLLRPLAGPAELIELHQQTAELVAQALEDGKDYGVIPGTGNKPTLLKPGAERLCLAFGVAPTYRVTESEIDHDRPVEWAKRKKRYLNRHRDDREYVWEEETGFSVGLYRYTVLCRLVNRATGEIVAEGLGVCSTMENKYIDRPRDCENTALKMAEKRALVAATLNAFALSDRFTQDVEDLPRDTERKPASGGSKPAANGGSRNGQSGQSGPRRMTSRYSSTCAVCRNTIAEGDPIYYDGATKRAWCEVHGEGAGATEPEHDPEPEPEAATGHTPQGVVRKARALIKRIEQAAGADAVEAAIRELDAWAGEEQRAGNIAPKGETELAITAALKAGRDRYEEMIPVADADDVVDAEFDGEGS